ncbi:PAS domain-containing protein [Peribacillus frigoritolerans]|nr:PAS domain-containing protein [Peribacillus frigoritolerans]
MGLEPKEIAWMFQEKHAILESIHEGIIAIDVHGKITVVNETAHKILHIPKDVMLRGQKIEEVITHTHLLDVVSTARAEYDQEFMIDGEVFFGKPDPHFEWTGGNHRCRCKFEK